MCYMEFRMKSKLKNHELMHIYPTPRICSLPNCGLVFRTESEIEAHELSHQERFKCEICGKLLASEKVHFEIYFNNIVAVGNGQHRRLTRNVALSVAICPHIISPIVRVRSGNLTDLTKLIDGNSFTIRGDNDRINKNILYFEKKF